MAWYLTEDIQPGMFPDEFYLHPQNTNGGWLQQSHIREDGKAAKCDVVPEFAGHPHPEGMYLIRFLDQDGTQIFVPKEQVEWEKITYYA